MTIEIHEPKLEALIQQRMASGLYQGVEDVLLQALEASPPPQTEASPKKKVNFAQFIMESPLGGTGIEFERIKDYPKPAEL